jgi:hypothetical protein
MKGDNKLLEIITEEELRDCYCIKGMYITEISKKYDVATCTTTKALEICNIPLKQYKHNKLLELLTKEELGELIYNQLMTPNSIGKLYSIDADTVRRALDILGIELDENIWSRNSSYKQRQLTSSGISLTNNQHQILIGSLLGDGSMGGKFSYFSITQSAKHKEYLEFLHKELEPFSNDIKEISNTTITSKNIIKVNKSFTFDTITYSDISEYKKIFYPNGKKIVPNNIYELLDTTALVHWYLQDGSSDKDSRWCCLCTQGFTTLEVETLVNVLYKKFNIKSHIQLTGTKKQPIIKMGAKGYEDLHNIVDPFIIFDCFKHKMKNCTIQVGHASKLTENDVREIRRLRDKGKSYKELSLLYSNVSNGCLQSVARRISWRHIV